MTIKHFNVKKKSLAFRLNNLSERHSGKPDYFLLGLIGVITFFGLMVLSSASSVVSFRDYNNAYYFFWHQFWRGFVPGIILFLIFAKINYRRWEKFSVAFFVSSLLLLLLVFVPGIGASYGRARSWINVAGFSFQPSEIVKLFLIFSLAGWFSYRGMERTKDFWNGLVPFALILGIITLPVALSDLGTAIVIVVIAIAVYFTAGAKISHLAGLGVIGIAAFAALIVQAPYRAQRLMTFLHPELDPQNIGYHINQAFLAIGSGGLFGLGFGQSRQKFAYLPEVMGDSIFAIISEELGFIFATLLVLAFLLLAWRGFRLARQTNDEYGKFVAAGITSWFIFQAFFNIAAMVGLMPLTGIPLPFISYGGTALAVVLAGAGVLVNISRTSD
ncbi:MAG: FtsW/RodA/SpoVE family cell cycle protein [Patescibacteria group bacterium]|jgi:cell division protein FtsW|nr:FtsW/RodA/SpoVE family cell cycle protein [Patescibacteria group bacterium]